MENREILIVSKIIDCSLLFSKNKYRSVNEISQIYTHIELIKCFPLIDCNICYCLVKNSTIFVYFFIVFLVQMRCIFGENILCLHLSAEKNVQKCIKHFHQNSTLEHKCKCLELNKI